MGYQGGNELIYERCLFIIQCVLVQVPRAGFFSMIRFFFVKFRRIDEILNLNRYSVQATIFQQESMHPISSIGIYERTLYRIDILILLSLKFISAKLKDIIIII